MSRLGPGLPGVTRFVRLRGPQGAVRLAWLVDEAGAEPDHVQVLRGDLFGRTEPVGVPEPLAGWTLLPPLVPGKIIGIGSNYRRHAEEMGKPVPTVPKIFLMPASAVVGPDEPIRIPPLTTRVDHEAELAVVIGQTARRVPVESALDHVLGYTAMNDVTARDFQQEDGTFTRAKGFDSFCPLGPTLAVGLDPGKLRVRAWVRPRGGGEAVLRQDGLTSDMVFSVAELVSFVSHVMTLMPGDLISTGTPSGVGPLVAGERVILEVEGVGRLENPVVDRADRTEG